jgi:hypothetical protein
VSKTLTDLVASNSWVNAGRTTSTNQSHVEKENSSGDNAVLNCLSNLVTPKIRRMLVGSTWHQTGSKPVPPIQAYGGLSPILVAGMTESWIVNRTTIHDS